MQKVKWKFLWLALVFVLALSIQVLGESNETVILSDFDIYEADIRDVFRSLAEIGNINVLIDPSVKGEATFKLKHGISVREALEMLAQTYGYSVRWMPASRTMLIGDQKTFANFEAKETRVYQFNYANVEQVADALKVIIPKEQIGIDKRTNQLTIKASILEHQNIVEIVSRLDQEMPQINIEARVEEISRTASRELGVTWEDPFTNVQADWSNLNFSKPVSFASLKALEEQSKAKLLANPNISTTDSQEGKIFIGDKYPIVITDVDDGKKVYKIEYVDVGTVLTVIPRINEDNVVTVTVKATVSNILEWKTVGENAIPVIRTREASSVIRLKDGETFALSGLNMNKNTDKKQTTPFLSNIPLLGSLFTLNKSGPSEDSEIVIFLTPKIVRTKPIDKPEHQTSVEKKAETKSKLAETVVEKPAEPVQLNTGINEPKAEVVEKPAVTVSMPVQSTEQTVKAVEAPLEQPVKVENAPLVSELPAIEPVKAEEALPIGSATAFQVKYRVKTGDNIANVAAKFGVDAEDIRQANNIQAGTDLGNIKELMIPVPENRIYVLKPKETLWRLAKRYGTTVEVLMELNNITDYTALEIGQQIVLPVSVDQVVDPRF
ncbi:MAG TPA: LysM peptidoglycan-binding domain-containing protein [Bacillota bacterium]|nr:LysM peptidoglycan-binding domain-containing protein [Bacillota bacterium]